VKTCVIGCGNLDRGDDAVGLLVVRRLLELAADADHELIAIEHRGDGLDLIDQWKNCEHVILVDALRSGGPPGSIRVVEAYHAPLPADMHCSSTHTFGLREAVELARALGQLPRSLLIYGIEASTFRVNAPVSLEVAKAVESVARHLAALLGSRHGFARSVSELKKGKKKLPCDSTHNRPDIVTVKAL
jgi:hydrogenase maturation protease